MRFIVINGEEVDNECDFVNVLTSHIPSLWTFPRLAHSALYPLVASLIFFQLLVVATNSSAPSTFLLTFMTALLPTNLPSKTSPPILSSDVSSTDVKGLAYEIIAVP